MGGNRRAQRKHSAEEMEDDCGDFNKLLGQGCDGVSSGSDDGEYAFNDDEADENIGNAAADSSDEQDDELESSNIEEELLRLDEMNRAQEDIQQKPAQVEDLTSTYRLLATMHKEGASGTINSADYEFLKILGDPRAVDLLQDQASDLIKQVESLFKTPVYKRMNKQKLLRQRINYSISDKTKQYLNKYDDMPFIVNITKDFCYKTGTKLFRKKTNTKLIPKINRKVYDKMVGFCVPVGEHTCSEEKNSELIKCVFME
ncbi:hypothetical protein NEPAR07_0574 [Nematocida parisii]|nr:hypothetical protein NEPAR07_0574 [Nematocida parisii]